MRQWRGHWFHCDAAIAHALLCSARGDGRWMKWLGWEHRMHESPEIVCPVRYESEKARNETEELLEVEMNKVRGG